MFYLPAVLGRDKSKSGYTDGVVLQMEMSFCRWCLSSMMRTMPLGSRIFADCKLPSWLSLLDLWLPSLGLQHSVHFTTLTWVDAQFTPIFPNLSPWDGALGENPLQLPAGVWTLIRSQVTSISQALDGTKQTLLIQYKQPLVLEGQVGSGSMVWQWPKLLMGLETQS